LESLNREIHGKEWGNGNRAPTNKRPIAKDPSLASRPLFGIPLKNGRKSSLFPIFSQSSGLKGNRKCSIAQDQGMCPVHGRTASAGKTPDSGAVAHLPQSTCPRPPWGKPNRGPNRSDLSIFRREPMKEPGPHDVLPWAGCIPWARPHPLPAANTWPRWEILRNHPLNWEKTLYFFFFNSASMAC
jgi:hypothetical protein